MPGTTTNRANGRGAITNGASITTGIPTGTVIRPHNPIRFDHHRRRLLFTLSPAGLPPAGGEARVRGPCLHEKTEPASLSHIEPHPVAGTPLTLPSPPADGGRGSKSEPASDPI